MTKCSNKYIIAEKYIPSEYEAAYKNNQVSNVLIYSTYDNWINVKDRLPEKDGTYLIVYTNGNYRDVRAAKFNVGITGIGYWGPTWSTGESYVGYEASHWMPLPELPKEIENKLD
jgi:hypothetical protein